MEASATLQEYAQEKIYSQISKFVTKPIEAHVTFSVDKHRHIAHCTLLGGDGFSLQVEHSCEDMYGSIDRILDKMVVQLRRKKDKLKGHKNRRNLRGLGLSNVKIPEDYQTAEIDADDIIKLEKARRRAAG